MKQKYQLGVMDLYPLAANKTQIENNPFIQVKFREKVDEKRLYEAVRQALSDHPLFACTLRYDKKFYLENNEAEFRLFHIEEKNRPLEFGDNTNGYLWQISYDECTVSFEWCHVISDGRGGLSFFTSVLCHYFNEERVVDVALDLGLEAFYDKEEKGIKQKKQEKGFSAKALPYIKRGYKTDCHILKVPIKDVLSVSKRSDSSPAAVLAPLFSMAIRKHIRKNVKNKNVSCNVVIDCRGPMKFKTMHNCILSKVITYVDRYDDMDYPMVSTIYRSIIDLAVQPENIICEATKMVDTIKPMVSVKPRFLQKALAKVVAAVMKHSDSNFTFTYLGKLEFPDKVREKIADVNFRSWTDFGECNIAAVDFDGTLILNICENYEDKKIVPDFIKECNLVGIHFEKADEFIFEQANMRMKML